MASVDDVPRDLEGSFLAKKEWQYPVEDRSGWLPANAQELADNHPWTRRAVEKNPRFPGYVPPEALFCWTEPDFASYINSGGFVKPKLRCQYYISPENPQTIVDLLEPVLSELNWTCTVDSKTGREESLSQVTDYMGMPVPTLKKQADGSLEVVKPREDIAPIFIWESSRNMIDHAPTLKFRGLVNRLSGVHHFTKVGMLELVRERCIERDIPINFPPPWYPLTFALPDDLEQWKRHAESNPHKKWIYKPNAEAMGRGIILVSKISDVDSRERPFRTRCKNVEVFDPKEPPLKERDFAHSGVIQEYMVNPLLLENRKFAVRVYMLVARTNPMLVFHYNFGYIKRCGQYYDENKFNREDLFRHVTEQEFQKKQEDFYETAAAELMSLEELDRYLQENYGIPAFRLNFWQQVKSICMEITLGIKEGIAEKGKLGQFEVFGLDVIVDADQRVYLLDGSFFEKWDFITSDDPTHGFVDYVSQAVADADGLIWEDAAEVFIGVDNSTVVPLDARGRKSIRLESKQRYNEGLFVLSLAHAPVSCGAWPAFWMFGEDEAHPWPEWGEFDIIEWVHEEDEVSAALHSKEGCSQEHLSDSMSASWSEGKLPESEAKNCYVLAKEQWMNQGCSQRAAAGSIGATFNGQGGGSYAAEWDPMEGHMRIWSWAAGTEPKDLVEKQPRPEQWGRPQFFFSLKENCHPGHFKNMKLVFDITFCGDRAGGENFDAHCGHLLNENETCSGFVRNNFSAFDEAYWSIQALDVYHRRDAARFDLSSGDRWHVTALLMVLVLAAR